MQNLQTGKSSSQTPTMEFQCLSQGLIFLDTQQIPLRWLNSLAAVDELGSLDLQQSVSLQIAYEYIMSFQNGTLDKKELERLYRNALQAQKKQLLQVRTSKAFSRNERPFNPLWPGNKIFISMRLIAITIPPCPVPSGPGTTLWFPLLQEKPNKSGPAKPLQQSWSGINQ
ncbi:MAG: hypothetical protein KGI54_11315 [Pseudomonadota bacterium]|nr:hypothetical protein [Pseudomonadota bacterium]